MTSRKSLVESFGIHVVVELNPYQATSGRDEPFQEGIDPAICRGLRRCRIAVVVLGIITGLAALGKLVLAISLMTAPVPEPMPELLGSPFDPPDIVETRRFRATMQIIHNGGFGLAFGLFASVLFGFAWRLSQCASGRIPLTQTLAAQNACWYTAAALAIAYSASNIWVW